MIPEEQVVSISGKVLEMLVEQKKEWPVVRARFEALKHVKVRTLTLSSFCHVRVQFNPDRIRSSKADISPEALAARTCFLCPAGRDPLQRTYHFGDYGIQVNPYPIFPEHFTVTYKKHVPQRITDRFADFLTVCRALDKLTVFYNGPHCGASAPDHCHFQACTRGMMPVENEWNACPAVCLQTFKGGRLLKVEDYFRTLFVIQGDSVTDLIRLFHQCMERFPVLAGEYEPRMNLIASFENGRYTVWIFPRSKSRPDCFYATGEDQRTISPASVEMGGLFITPVEKDFRSLSVQEVVSILDECTL